MNKLESPTPFANKQQEKHLVSQKDVKFSYWVVPELSTLGHRILEN